MRPVNIPIPDDLVPVMAAHLISQVGAVTPPAKAVVDAVGRVLLEDLEPDGDLSAALVPVDSVAASRRRWPGRTVHIECETLDQVRESLEAGADALLLDNMTQEALHETVLAIREFSRGLTQDVLLEASGGITLETAGLIAAAGVDRLSVGALTHSAPALDLSMLMDEMRSA